MRAVKELKAKYNKLKREQKIKFLMDLFINITLDDEDAADIGYVPRKEAAFIFTDPAPKRNDVINNLMKTQQVEQRQTTAPKRNDVINNLMKTQQVEQRQTTAPKRNDVINNLMKTQQVEQRQTTANQFVNSLRSSYPVTYNGLIKATSGNNGDRAYKFIK